MNRWSTTVVLTVMAAATCLTLFGATPSGASEFQSVSVAGTFGSPPETAIFEMKYRGLDKPDDPLTYRSFWGFGGPGDGVNEPFVQAVKSQVKDCTVVYNGSLPRVQWSVVELQDKKPAAFYFDLNADGKLAENEKFLPSAAPNMGFPYVFVTSDFRVGPNREFPFRVMLVANERGNGEYSFMWSPHCVLEGQATLGGTPMKLILFANGFSGSFTEFGRASLALLPAEQKIEGYLPRSTFSSLVTQQGTFYHVKPQDVPGKDGTVRVVMEKDTSPTGKAALHITGKEETKAHLAGVRLQGAKDATIQMFVGETEPTLPVGAYRITSGSVAYGRQSEDEWQVSFNEGPTFEIKEGETTRLEFGQPVLAIKAIAESDRYRSNAKERTTYAKGTPIYLSPEIKGKAGEIYGRFMQKDVASNNFSDVKPHIAILDADGRLVVSADMEYG
jgi:hypothetical protein